ncbi:MAG: hypothetical protein OXH99_07585 [Bryobacterales bacterium]|nr:hypothetical protein [Bryobacterales bacterium]
MVYARGELRNKALWKVQERLQLVSKETAGDPTGGLLWTFRSLSKLAAEVSQSGVKVSATTVGKWLNSCGYSLHVNRKTLSRTAPPGRDEQGKRIAGLHERCRAERIPIASADAKKRRVPHFRARTDMIALWNPASRVE